MFLQEYVSRVLWASWQPREEVPMYGIEPNTPISDWTEKQLLAVQAQISERNPPTEGPRFERLQEIKRVLAERGAVKPLDHQQV